MQELGMYDLFKKFQAEKKEFDIFNTHIWFKCLY